MPRFAASPELRRRRSAHRRNSAWSVPGDARGEHPGPQTSAGARLAEAPVPARVERWRPSLCHLQGGGEECVRACRMRHLGRARPRSGVRHCVSVGECPRAGGALPGAPQARRPFHCVGGEPCGALQHLLVSHQQPDRDGSQQAALHADVGVQERHSIAGAGARRLVRRRGGEPVAFRHVLNPCAEKDALGDANGASANMAVCQGTAGGQHVSSRN
mmetsp:Transcript_14710/g.46903  ORF Transcript_14710/g.46903 Transcript_14710/m.46903 type:complete len:216 (+) Transcript_14710:1733-2380(+)